MLQMLVHGINLDIVSNQPVVILKDLQSHCYLPIWIGQFEATSILMELQGIKPTRPLTHDLLKTLLETFNIQPVRVVITDLIDGTFYARLILNFQEQEFEIDSRPSDAIAIAVRFGVPIYATEQVIKQASVVTDEGEEVKIEQFRNFLEKLNPEDFKE